MEQESAIRKILKNEFAQIGAILGVVWFAITNFVIPMNNIQLKLSDIQVTLTDIKSINSSLDARITQNSNDIIKLKERMTKYNFPQ